MYSFTLVVLLVWKFALSKEDFLSYFLTRSNLWESPRQSRGFTSMNYSTGFAYIWNEIPVLVTFESNWSKAKEILTEIAKRDADPLSRAAEESVRRAARKFMIFYTHLSPVVYTKIADSGVLLTIRYLCEPRNRRGTEQTISEEILERFAECDDIDFAYPTYRIYDNPAEGKEGARAEVPARR